MTDPRTACRVCYDAPPDFGLPCVNPATLLVPFEDTFWWEPRCLTHVTTGTELSLVVAERRPVFPLSPLRDVERPIVSIKIALRKAAMPACYVCLTGLCGKPPKRRSSRFVAPLVTRVSEPATWVPICAWHVKDWYSCLRDPADRLPMFEPVFQ